MGHAVTERRRGAEVMPANGGNDRRPYDRRGSGQPDPGLASPFHHFRMAGGDRRIRAADRRVARRVAAGNGVTPAQQRAIIFNTYVVCTIDGFISRAAVAAGRAGNIVRHAVGASLDRVFQERPKQLALLLVALLVSWLLVYGAFIDIIDPLRNGRIVAEEGHSFIQTFRPGGAEWYEHIELFDNGGYQYRGSLTGRQDRTPAVI